VQLVLPQKPCTNGLTTMKLKAIGCLAALLLIVGKIEANEKPAPCVVYFSVVQKDVVPVPLSVSKMNKAQSSWYEKHGDRDKYAGICYAESGSDVAGNGPLYAIVWGEHLASEPYVFSYDLTPQANAEADQHGNSNTAKKKDYVADGWLAIWDPKANQGKGTFVTVTPLQIQNHTDLNAAPTSLLIEAMEQISQKENEKLAAAASERDPHKKSKEGKEGNERNGWTEITITPIDNGQPAPSETASTAPRSSSDPIQPTAPSATTATEYSPVPAPAGTSTVSVSSTPTGADIFLDEDFVGNTPSTINVPPGRHVVTVKKSGFQNWARVVNFSGGLVTLNANLAAGSGPSEMPTSLGTTTAESTKESPRETVAAGMSSASSQKSTGWIGVSAKNGLAGALVINVSAEGPAARAGIHVGDVILALDGQLIKGKDFATEVAALKPGTRIPIDYTRGSAAHEVWVLVGSQN
jgi:PEGA domain/PDZ domain